MVPFEEKSSVKSTITYYGILIVTLIGIFCGILLIYNAYEELTIMQEMYDINISMNQLRNGKELMKTIITDVGNTVLSRFGDAAQSRANTVCMSNLGDLSNPSYFDAFRNTLSNVYSNYDANGAMFQCITKETQKAITQESDMIISALNMSIVRITTNLSRGWTMITIGAPIVTLYITNGAYKLIKNSSNNPRSITYTTGGKRTRKYRKKSMKKRKSMKRRKSIKRRGKK